MKQELLKFCVEKGVLLDKNILDIVEKINETDLIKNLIERINYMYKQKIITKSFFFNNLNKVYELISHYKGNDKKVIVNFFSDLGIKINENKKEDYINKNNTQGFVNNIELTKIYQNNPKKLEVNNFVKNFKNRFNKLKSFLQERAELENLVSINRIDKGKQLSIIAMVFNKKITKNGNVLLELEDLTGKVIALVNKDRKEIFEKTKEILLDEVIALKCSGSGEIVFVNDIIFPDAIIYDKKYSKIDESIAFISDIHIGSNKFLEDNFLKFIKWINGEIGDENQKKEALKIKYMFITGDTIDGVGVYPGQENELIIKDVKEQYKKLGELLSKIRPDIQMIMCAGQHDAVRVAEPQPIVSEFYAQSLYYLKNLNIVTNPSLISVGKDIKFKVLMYHGASMHGIINSIESLRLGKGHNSPTDVVKFMLKKRHLAPTHSLVTYTPLDDEDALLINEIPDIVSTGDLHKPEISEYNNILLIASSCWQSKTPFEEKVGNNPDPCKVPIFNLKSRDVKIIDFSEGLDSEGNLIKKNNKDGK